MTCGSETECANHNRPTPQRLTSSTDPTLKTIEYRLTVVAFRCQHGMVPSYLSSELRRASDVVSGRSVRSSTTALVVPRTFNNRRELPVAACHHAPIPTFNCIVVLPLLSIIYIFTYRDLEVLRNNNYVSFMSFVFTLH